MASTSGGLSNVGEEGQEIHYKRPRLEELPSSATAQQVSVTETHVTAGEKNVLTKCVSCVTFSKLTLK